MNLQLKLPLWTLVLPVLAWISYNFIHINIWTEIIGGILLVASVLAAVFHAETIAHKVGEPFGTIVLALAITVLEVALIVSLMIAGGKGAETLPRDTVFAAIMIIMNGILGGCLLLGGAKFHEQFFGKSSANTALITLVAILVLTLVLPNFTTSISGPYYNDQQLVFVSIISLVLYGSFIMVQTHRHKNYFVTEEDKKVEEEHQHISTRTVIVSFIFLVLCLAIVVLMSKALSPTIEGVVVSLGAPQSFVGVIIAAIVLLPEGLAAIKAARKNQLQTSLNLTLGSALASIGLTIPSVSVVCLIYDMDLVLGLDMKAMVLLALTIFIAMLSLNQGKTNILYGIVLIVNLFAYLFTVIIP